MNRKPTIEVEELVRPLPGGAPDGPPLPGVPLPTDVRRNLDTWRKEPDPDFPDETNVPPPPEWGKIIATTTDLLTNTGKDLTAAVRLVEAVTKKHAARGLADGLTLLTRLAEECWDRVHPISAPGEDQEARRNRLEWLNNIGEGGKFPGTVMRMPVVETTRRDTFAAVDWLDPTRRAEVEANAPAFQVDKLKQSLAELKEAQAAFRRLGTVLDEKMGQDAPNLSEDSPGGLGLAISKCLEFVRGLAQVKGVTLEDAPSVVSDDPSSDTTDGDDGGDGGGRGPAVGGGRDQLYRSLAQIAAALKRAEPHSPIPYLLERCVRLGAMPFPELMREVIREDAALNEIDRLLGLTRAGGGAEAVE